MSEVEPSEQQLPFGLSRETSIVRTPDGRWFHEGEPIENPKLASLCMALTTVAFWWFVCWLMSLVGFAIRV